MKKRAFHLAVLIFTSLFLYMPAAADFSQIVAFGDSLTDNGTNIIYGDLHGIDHFSNGDVWVEYLAQSRDIPLDDWAYGAAYTGYGTSSEFFPNEYGLLWQTCNYITDYFQALPSDQPLTLDTSALYTIWAGGNDFLGLPAGATQADIGATIATATGNIVTAVNLLAVAGAQNFLVLNLPDLGKTPRYNYDPTVSTGASGLASAFNQALDDALATYTVSGINLCQLDTFAFLNDTINDGYFTNSTDVWKGSGEDPKYYLFWDEIHPTTGAHWLLSEVADEQLNSCVPVPPSFLLLISGLAGLIGIKRRLNA